MNKKRNDIILIAVLVAVALLSWLAVTLTRHDGAWAVVKVDGEELARYPLDEDIEVTIGDSENYNVLVISGGYADVTEASCPDKICVRQSKIKYDGETITCLPNRTVIVIEGGQQSDIDVTVD